MRVTLKNIFLDVFHFKQQRDIGSRVFVKGEGGIT